VNCTETHNLLHGYLDGELDLVRNLEFEQHLQSCPACGQSLEQQQRLRTAVSGAGLYMQAPAGLRERLQKRLREAAAPAEAAETSAPAPRRRWRPERLLAVAASLGLLAVGGWALTQVVSRSSGRDLLVKELVTSHVRSQMLLSHLTDVASSNSHTVKPWFQGKVNFAPPVSDFADQGFPLKGGRLDYVDDQPAAVLVYKRHDHVIDVFIWKPSDAADSKVQRQTQQGFHIVHWTSGGLTYWAVSDLNMQELETLVGLVQKAGR
jgi:mycothiol system anti-sigma-R factor